MDPRRESHSGAACVVPELNPTPKTRRYVAACDRRQLRKSEGRVAHDARYQLRFRLDRAVSGGRGRQHGLQNPSAWGDPGGLLIPAAPADLRCPRVRDSQRDLGSPLNPDAPNGPLILCAQMSQRASLDQTMTCDHVAHVALRDLRFAREP